MDKIKVNLLFGLFLISQAFILAKIMAHDMNYSTFMYVPDLAHGAVKG